MGQSSGGTARVVSIDRLEIIERRGMPASQDNTGMALTEVVCMMAAGAILAAICFPLISRLYFAKNALRQDLRWQQSLHAVGLQLRSDVHFATDSESGNDQTLRLSVDSMHGEPSEIEYRLQDGILHRTIMSKNGTLLSREAYIFGNGVKARFEHSADDIGLRLSVPSYRLKDQVDREIEIRATRNRG